MCGLNYLCSECSTELSKAELELNTKFPIGKLYCSFCQSKKERILIKELAENIANDLDFYDYEKYDPKEKDYSYKGRSISFMLSGKTKNESETDIKETEEDLIGGKYD